MLSLALVAATSAAAAAVPTGSVVSSTDLDAPHKIRSGIVIGLSLGAGIVGASGYPNEWAKIGNPDYYSSSGWMTGSGEGLFVMGALTDYLSFGFWYAHAGASNPHWQSTGSGVGLRVELFPLYGIERWRGLGLVGQFGLGSGDLSAKVPNLPSSEGTSSFAAAGVFHEWAFRFLGGHFAAGPSLEYSAIWSQAFERHGLALSARLVFYGGGGG